MAAQVPGLVRVAPLQSPLQTPLQMRPALQVQPVVAAEADFEALLGLRVRAMRPSLEALGRFDPERARLQDGLITAGLELWAACGKPPAGRTPQRFAGLKPLQCQATT